MPAPLESWNDGAAKSAIIDFVTKVTTADGPDFVPPAERIATFDNDGTLWLEKPLYIQLQHGLRAIGKAAAEKPELRDRQPFKAVYEKDMAWLGKAAADYAKGDPSGVFILVSGLTEVLEGITVEAFEADVLEFLSNAQDTRFKKAVQAADLPADGRAGALPAGQRLSGLYHLRRRPRFHARGLRGDLQHPARHGHRQQRNVPVQ